MEPVKSSLSLPFFSTRNRLACKQIGLIGPNVTRLTATLVGLWRRLTNRGTFPVCDNFEWWLSSTGCRRHACEAEREEVRLLSRTVHRRHVHCPHPSTHAVLRLQPHHPVRPYLLHGAASIHSAARIRRENIARYAAHDLCSVCLVFIYFTGKCLFDCLARLWMIQSDFYWLGCVTHVRSNLPSLHSSITFVTM